MPTTTYSLAGRLPLFDGLANVKRYNAASDFVRAGQFDFDWTRFQLDRNVVMLYTTKPSAPSSSRTWPRRT